MEQQEEEEGVERLIVSGAGRCECTARRGDINTHTYYIYLSVDRYIKRWTDRHTDR